MITGKSKRVFQVIFVSLLAICLCMGGLLLGGSAAPVHADDTLAAEVTGVQVRSAGSDQSGGYDTNGYNMIVLQNDMYAGIVQDTSVSNAGTYNTRSKVKIFTSADDSEGIYLTEICGTWWTQNIWSCAGLCLMYNTPADYATYNGATIYKIAIEAGCELPCGDKVYTTSETVTYINQDFGNESAKYMASSWQKEIPVLDGDVSGVQIRSAGAWETSGTENFIVLQSSVYEAGVSGTIAAANYNTLSKIKIYTSPEDAEGELLSDGLIGGWWEYSYWNTNALFLAYNTPADYGTYNGATIYKIVIEEGCELPCGSVKYVTTEEKTFYNLDYSNENAVNSAVNWKTTSMIGNAATAQEAEGIFHIEEASVKEMNYAGTYRVDERAAYYFHNAMYSGNAEVRFVTEGTTSVGTETVYEVYQAYQFSFDYKIENTSAAAKYTVQIVLSDGSFDTVTFDAVADGEWHTFTYRMPFSQTEKFAGFAIGIGKLEGEMLIANLVAEKDTTAPVITVTTVENEWNEGTMFTYDVTAVDAVDGPVTVTLVAPAEMLDGQGDLLPGTWKVSFTASDAMGNKATSDEYTITVKDVTAPVITLGGETQYEAGTAYTEGSALSLMVAITDNVDESITQYTVELEEGAVLNGKLQVGTWTVTVRASDTAENEGSATIQITVADTTKPVITLNNESTQTQYDEGEEPAIVATAQDSYDGEVEVELVIPEGALQDGKLVAGEWTITLMATDSAGNAADPVTVTITAADKTAPVITLGGETEYEVGTAYTAGSALGLTVEVNDNLDGEITQFTVELEEGTVLDGKLQAGTWTVTVKASDAAGNASSATIQITVADTTKPVITLDSEHTVTQYSEGDELNIVATAQDSYDGEVEVELVIPEGALQDGKLVAGEWTITLTATDSAGNAADPVTVTIEVTAGAADTEGSGCGSVIGGSAGIAIAMAVIGAAALALVWKRRNKNR